MTAAPRPADTATPLGVETLWSDDALEISFVPGDGSDAVVVFSSAEDVSPHDGRFEFAFAAMGAARRPGFWVRDRRGHWYQDGGVADRVVAVVTDRLRDLAPRRILTAGYSMGGYGALIFGWALGATSVLAFGPQYDIASGFAPADTRWPELRSGIEAFTLGPVSGAMMPQIAYYVLHGARGPDILHWSAFPEGENIRHYLFDGHWHPVARHLRDLGLLADAFEAALEDDVDAFDALIAEAGGRPRAPGETYMTHPNDWYRAHAAGQA